MKILELLSRRADQTREQALTYWTERHAALVKERVGGSGMVMRYVNNVGLTKQSPTAVPPFDGVVGAWLRVEPADFVRQIGTPGNVVVADEPNFLACHPGAMLVEEHVIREAERGGTKLMIFLRRAPDLDREAFEIALLGEVAQSLQSNWGAALTGLTVNLGRPMTWGHWGPEWPLYDAAIELWLSDSVEDVLARTAKVDPALQRVAPAPAFLVVREVFQIDLPLD